MLRKTILILSLMLWLPLAASAMSVQVGVEPWRTLDGNFGYSVVHHASGGHMSMGGLDFYAGGGISHEVAGPTQYLTGDLTGDVLTITGGTLSLVGGGTLGFDYSVLDFGVASGSLIGSLGYELTESSGSVEIGSFYFYNFDYTNGSCDANGLCDDGEYRLWGNNWDAAEGLPSNNVVRDGQLVTARRGIDLGGQVSAPVPEPSAALLFGAGALVAGSGLRRRGPRPGQ